MLTILKDQSPLPTEAIYYRTPQWERDEIDYALASLSSEGQVLPETRTGPVRHGATETREWTYWHAIPDSAEVPSVAG